MSWPLPDGPQEESARTTTNDASQFTNPCPIPVIAAVPVFVMVKIWHGAPPTHSTPAPVPTCTEPKLGAAGVSEAVPMVAAAMVNDCGVPVAAA